MGKDFFCDGCKDIVEVQELWCLEVSKPGGEGQDLRLAFERMDMCPICVNKLKEYLGKSFTPGGGHAD